MKVSPQTAQEEDVDVLEDVGVNNILIVHNDSVNTFDWVIETLVEVCKHTWEQAEQCAYIIHHKGKYAVKHGDLDRLKPMKDEITGRGIGATIE
jgi:ATP-dependent Clp protease adaptor protein ClpS